MIAAWHWQPRGQPKKIWNLKIEDLERLMMSINRWFRKPLLAGMLLAVPAVSFAQFSVGISINIAPPVLPVYVQPPCPSPNYMWTPGYWAWDTNVSDYFWVPGTWVAAPQPGYLWTPGYWGWGNGAYLFHTGYWGTQVGFYGGVNYGFGFGGNGFGGGEWRNGTFAYNTAVVSVNTTVIHNTYINRTVINNTTINNNHTSFNGGPNGISARPTPREEAFAKAPHVQPTAAQEQHRQVASQDKANFVSVNHGAPAHAAVARPATSVAELQHSAVPAKLAPGAKPVNTARPAMAGNASKPAAQPASRPSPVAHPQPNERPAARPQGQPAAVKPAARPAPEEKRAPTPAAKPAPRPAPEARPAAAAKPAPKPAPRPAEKPKEPEKHSEK